MNGPTGSPDPNGLTQPIPVVVVPVRPRSRPTEPAAPVGTTAQATETAAPRVGYVHRFGNVPFYLCARFAAFVLDVFGVGFLLATFAFHASEVGFYIVMGRDPNGYTTLVELSLGSALAFAFVCESIFGTTLGKLLFALHVRRGNGRHAGALRVFVRYLVRPLDLLVVGPLLALVTPRRQRIGDFVTGTVVARSRIGPFASVLGVAAIVGALYAQIVYGGGLTSAVGVAAETAAYAPSLVVGAINVFGVRASAPSEAVPHVSASDAPIATPVPLPSAIVQ